MSQCSKLVNGPVFRGSAFMGDTLRIGAGIKLNE